MIRTYDLPNTGRALYPLSYRELMEDEATYWVHIWHASCKLLGSAMSRSYFMVEEWKMENFKAGWTNVKINI